MFHLCIRLIYVFIICVSYQLIHSVLGLPANFNSDFGAGDVDSVKNVLEANRLLASFVVFRHGDRTPQQIELNKYPHGKFNDSIFYPFGKEALTNKGKQRAFKLGESLRKRYNDTISQLYLPNEITVRSTALARTKMTALVVLAGLYPPPLEQKWNKDLDWQPIPYYSRDFMDDDLTYFAHCARYYEIKDSIYNIPEVLAMTKPYLPLLEFLNEKTKGNITNPENVLFLDNLFQAFENVGIKNDKWVDDVFPKIKEMTKIEYYCSFYNDELVKLSTGVLLSDVVNIMKKVVDGDKNQQKLYLFSGHENTVAAVLAAFKVFKPHQPKYCSSVALELRQNSKTGKHGVMIVYAPEAGGPAEALPNGICNGKYLCDFDELMKSIQNILLPRSELKKECNSKGY